MKTVKIDIGVIIAVAILLSVGLGEWAIVVTLFLLIEKLNKLSDQFSDIQSNLSQITTIAEISERRDR